MLAFLDKNEALFAQVKPSEDQYLAWVSIHPNIPTSRNSLTFDSSKKFIVRRFEVMKGLYAKFIEMNRLLVESQCNNFMRIEVRDEVELEQILSKWVDDMNVFTPHSTSNFPFE